GDTQGREPDEELEVSAVQSARRLPQLQELPQIARRAAVDAGRRLEQKRFDEFADPLQGGVKPAVRLGVLPGEPGYCLDVAIVAVQRHRTPVGERNEEGGVLPDDLVAVTREVEALHDLRQKKRADVGGGGDFVAWEELLGNAGASHHGSGL